MCQLVADPPNEAPDTSLQGSAEDGEKGGNCVPEDTRRQDPFMHSTQRPLLASTEESKGGCKRSMDDELNARQFKSRPAGPSVPCSSKNAAALDTDLPHNPSSGEGPSGTDHAGSKTPRPFKEPPIPLTTNDILRVILVTGALRLLGVLMIRSYFDPDEFWQTLEPAYCLIFGSDQGKRCPGYTWEWKRRALPSVTNWVDRSMQGPARTHLALMPTYLLYWAAQKWSVDSWWLVARGPTVLSALLVAAPVDVSVWYAARYLYAIDGSVHAKNAAGWCLFASLASWFNGYSLARTFSNSQEASLLAVALALVSPALLNPRTTRLSTGRACLAFFLGGLSAAIRFTALAAFVPIGVILAGRSSTTTAGFLGYLLMRCAIPGLAGLAVAAAVDRFFFGFWTLPFLGNFHFNVILKFSTLYGAHPWHWYWTAGLPAITGLLLPVLLLNVVRLLHGQVSYGARNLLLITVFYVFVMSFNGHKEFRYIHPVLPLVCLLSGGFFYKSLGMGSRLVKFGFVFVFVLANFVPVVYLGLFHQSGPIAVNRAIVEEAQGLATTTHGGGGVDSVPTTTFSVYYLTECHSGPLHSHLHTPPIRFDAWSLDCSSDCRSDPRRVCESDRFAHDPAAFLEAAVCDNDVDVGTCVADAASGESVGPRPVPDFVVTYASRVPALEDWLRRNGLDEVARFPHHINGAQWADRLRLGEGAWPGPFRSWTLGATGLEIRLEDTVLYSRHAPAVATDRRRHAALPGVDRY